MTARTSHAFFHNYALPPAAALSVMVHGVVATLVLWRGALWFESSGGGRGGDRPAVTWVALPPTISPQAEPRQPSPRRSTIRGLTPPRIERVSLALPPRGMARTVSIPVPVALSGPMPDPVGPDEAVSDSPGQGTSCGGASEVSAIPDSARDILRPSSLPLPPASAEAPPDNQRTHDVQFWIRADGRVTRIVVTPPIRDSEYRRRFRAAMRTFVFGPVQTPDGRRIDYVYNCVVYP